MMDNICRFIPTENDSGKVDILNFVYETNQQAFEKNFMATTYRLYFVTDGKASFVSGGTSYTLTKGDVFITIPSKVYELSPERDFRFMYISFLGKKMLMLLDKFGISTKNCVFKELGGIEKMWWNAIAQSEETLEIASEGILLYTFSEIGNRMYEKKSTLSKSERLVLSVKKYIDDSFFDYSLSPMSVAKHFSYNAKYVTTLFKNETGTGLSDYIRSVRLSNAITLIEQQGCTSVKDIASLCGFSDALYFGKVFRKEKGISPKEYIKKTSQKQQ